MSKETRKSRRRKQRKKRKALRISKRVVLSLIVLSILSVIGYIAYATIVTGAFRIKTIRVTGSEILPDDKIIEASGIKEGMDIFTLDINNARYNISQAISAEQIVIKRILPDTIEIEITENEPLAVISHGGKNYYLNEDREIMEITDELGKNDTPIIFGLQNYDFQGIGEKANADPEYKFDQVLSILQLFKNNGFLSDLSDISLTDQNTYRIITKNGIVFTVKDLSNLKEYFDYVSSVIENGEVNQDINLASGNNPIKKQR